MKRVVVVGIAVVVVTLGDVELKIITVIFSAFITDDKFPFEIIERYSPSRDSFT